MTENRAFYRREGVPDSPDGRDLIRIAGEPWPIRRRGRDIEALVDYGIALSAVQLATDHLVASAESAWAEVNDASLALSSASSELSSWDRDHRDDRATTIAAVETTSVLDVEGRLAIASLSPAAAETAVVAAALLEPSLATLHLAADAAQVRTST